MPMCHAAMRTTDEGYAIIIKSVERRGEWEISIAGWWKEGGAVLILIR